MVVYNALIIERLEQDNKKRYKTEDYQKLNQFYQNKVQQIHIVGESDDEIFIRESRLDFLLSCQNLISQLDSGDVLAVNEDCCRNSKGQVVLRFSKQLIKQIEAIKQKSYIPKTAKIRFIIYWKKEDLDYEIRIVLPELYFEREEDC